MPQYSRAISKELKQCAMDLVSDCGLTTNRIKSLEGNPAGITKVDYVNPNYKGKIMVSGDNINIRLNYIMTGNIARAQETVKNIKAVYATQNIIVEFIPNPGHYDLRIHGASLSDFANGLRACECKGMLRIGGWGPSYKNKKWGDALLVNPHVHRIYWRISDAHEFGHKLGLQHRTNLGIMDYWDEEQYRRDPRKFLASEKSRIAKLYG